MNFKSNNLILPILIGILASGIPAMTLCSSHYGAGYAGLDFPEDALCSLSAHSFVQVADELSVIGVIPLFGILLFRRRFFIPAGFMVTIFKPPRFSQLI